MLQQLHQVVRLRQKIERVGKWPKVFRYFSWMFQARGNPSFAVGLIHVQQNAKRLKTLHQNLWVLPHTNQTSLGRADTCGDNSFT
jgi:hypothetical protein